MVSIKDVARLAGVTPTTVSKVLNGKGSISVATKERVLASAKELGYSPSSVARSLVTGSIGIVAVLVDDLASPYFLDFIDGVNHAASKSKFKIIYCSIGSQEESRGEYMRALKNGLADGMIIYGSFQSDDKELEYLLESNHPFVAIENELPHLEINNLLIDNVQGAYTATDSMILDGHTRIAHIAGSPEIKAAVRRMEGYKRALHVAGIAVVNEYISYSNQTYQGGYERMRELLSLASPPTAVFCYDDVTAIGAIDAVFARGLSVPEDISVIGFDDQRILPAHNIHVPLSTIRQPLFDLGKDSFDILIQAIEEPSSPKVIRHYRTELIRRASTAKVKR